MNVLVLTAALVLALGSPRLGRPVATVWRRMSARGSRAGDGTDEVDLLGRLLVLCLTGGLALPEALRECRPHVGPAVRSEIDAVLGRARRTGMGPALADPRALTAPLFTRLAAAQASGAPMVGALDAYLEGRRLRARSESMERARTLPIKLMIPVALLILPGLLLLAVGPELLGRLPDVLGPVWNP